MNTDLRTLSKVLSHFHEELHVCMNHQDKGGPFHHNDPIFLGSFIVDAYNNYLEAAKNASDHGLINTMSRIETIDEATLNAVMDEGDLVGRDPRLQKMHEVAMAAKQLTMIIDGLIQTGHGDIYSEIDGVIALLDPMGEQLGELHHMGGTWKNDWRDTLEPIMAKYNDLLSVALESTNDPVMEKLFNPLAFDESYTPDSALSELRLAQRGLREYLHRRYVEQRNPS